MIKKWQLQDAKKHLSEVINKAVSDGPQVITRRGEETVVVLSFKEFKKLTKVKTSLVHFFQTSPFHEINLDLERHQDFGRETTHE